jgi:hypothetical protein
MDEPLIAGTGSDGIGSIDVDRELESIERFKELGMNVEGMEELLFNDIESYKKRKVLLLRHEIQDIPMVGNYQEPEMEIIGIDDPDHDFEIKEPEISTVAESDINPSAESDEELLLYSSSMDENDRENQFDTDIDLSLKNQENANPSETREENTEEKNEDLHDSDSEKTENEKLSESYEKRKNVKKSTFRQRKSWIIPVSISLGIVVLLLSIFFVSIFLQDDPDENDVIDTSIILSDINPEAGNVVYISADPISDEMKYSWEIQPEDFRFTSGDDKASSFEVYFKKSQIYTIKLSATRGGKDIDSSVSVDVQDRTISLGRERYSDLSRYEVSGHIEYNDLATVKKSFSLGIEYNKMEADYWTVDSSPMKTEIFETPVKNYDGFSDEYDHMCRITEQDLRLSGSVRTNPPLERISSLTGTISMTQTSYMDLFNKRPTSMISDLLYELNVQAVGGNTVTEKSEESIWTYPSLANSFSDLRVEDLSSKRTITNGDEGETRWGSYNLRWKGIEYDRIMETPALKIEMDMDSSTMQKLMITDITAFIWIGDGIGQIMKTVVNITSSGNRLDHSQTMVDHERGADPVVFGLLENQHDSFSDISGIFPDLSNDFHSNWVYFPKYGSFYSSIPDDLDAQIAVSTFEESPNFKNFLRTRTDPYGLYSNFSIILGKDQWKISIGDSGDDRCWNQTVRREKNPPGLTDNIEPVSITRDDIGNLLTYSASELSLKRILARINPEGAREIFGVNSPEETRKVDLNDNAIGTKANLEYPLLGLIDPTLSERIPYGFFISALDSSAEVGLDMTTGQLAYVRIVK